jgi:SAM-dependent methyltransferase
VGTRQYLGKDLSPKEYYKLHHGSYNNPHSPGIRYVVDKHMHHLHGTVLDLGCGNGLASMILWSYSNEIIGVDSEPGMIDRYQQETMHRGVVGDFWDPLPKADSAVFCYSIHLCPESRVSMVDYRLCEAGVTSIIVVSPLKARGETWPSFQCIEESVDRVGPHHKTVYGRVYQRNT